MGSLWMVYCFLTLCIIVSQGVKQSGYCQDCASCLNSTLICNGIPDCKDGSDEHVSRCGCLPNEFMCTNSCIDLLKRCDSKNDCPDGEDEHDCRTYQCPLTHYKCKNHICIPFDLVCNFENDCGDDSDEPPDCPHRTCWRQEFRCNNTECIRPGFLCDGVSNCKDGSDEINCTEDDFVKCGDGSLKHRYYRCDGWPDCIDNHADEINCEPCEGEEEFLCPNGRCIRRANVCDAVCDCLPPRPGLPCPDELHCRLYYTDHQGLRECAVGRALSCFTMGQFEKTERCIREEHVCDGRNDCHNGRLPSDESGCYREDAILEGMFQCLDLRWIPYVFVCDFKVDCLHGEDELNCTEPLPCLEGEEFRCDNGQCVTGWARCDLRVDCWDKSDEINCHNFTCPEGMTSCQSGHCLLLEQWCDIFEDCFDSSDEANCSKRECREDEWRCDNGQCVDLKHRCFNSGAEAEACADKSHLNHCEEWTCREGQLKCHRGPCLDPALLCDSKIDCLATWEDEDGCPFVCSELALECECQNIHINCTGKGLLYVPDDTEREITWFHLGNNYLGRTINQGTFRGLSHLLYLDLSKNGITSLPPGMFGPLWRLTLLNLRDNFIEELSKGAFHGLSSLVGLHIQGNMIHNIHSMAFYGLSSLTTLDLHGQKLSLIDPDAFVGLRNLTSLDLSQNKIQYLDDGSFRGLFHLLYLDLRNNQIQDISPNVFKPVINLEKLLTDEFRLCCLARHVARCYPPRDEFSSCEDLMSNIFLRVCVWILALVAIAGNLLVITWRARFKYCNKVNSFLIMNLAAGDLVMGSYLLLIALVDHRYRGIYFLHDTDWRSSRLCSLAGFMSTFSSELSVFTLTVITVVRFNVIINPFRGQRLKMAQTKVIMMFVWAISALLSAIPFMDYSYFRNFYGRSGVCLALHITPDKHSGWEYSVFVFLFLNLVSFTVIAVGYLWMFLVAKTTHQAVHKTSHSTDSVMAWRMTLLVATDAACWVPIILLGFVSLAGFTVPPQVFAWVAVFVLPLNAALNPVLYTLSTAPFLAPARSSLSSLKRSYHLSLNSVPKTHPIETEGSKQTHDDHF